jgi:hypothetical protein
VRLVFDLGGVLVNSREANLASYRAIGVEPPENFDKIAWETWCSPDHHKAKRAALQKHRGLIQPLPLLELALQAEGLVISACHEDSLEMACLVVPGLRRLRVQCGVRDKVTLLAGMDNGPGVYYDDSLLVCEEVQRRTKWQVMHALTR